MAESYWRYGSDPRYQQDPRYQTDPRFPAAMPPHSAAAAAGAAPASAAAPVKRPRPDFADLPAGPELLGYYPRGEERSRPVGDTETLAASYDRYIRNGMSSYAAPDPVRPVGGRPDDLRLAGASIDGRTIGYGGGRPEAALPPDATNTLYVEGLPANCTRREVSHIFRPFVGFQEVRLVKKESKHHGGDALILCFVDFNTPAQAAVALDALQGYKFDEHDRESNNLRLQFARFPGPRSGGGPRGRR